MRRVLAAGLLAWCAPLAVPARALDSKTCEPRWTFPVPFYQSIAWSPDGSKIAFAAVTTSWDEGYGIFVVDSDGSGLRRLQTGGQPALYPVFSPGGSRIAFTLGRDGRSDVYVMEADGNEMTRLTDHESGDGYPSWSPDGKGILFASEGLWTVAADGSGPQRLLEHAVYGAWSPDGSTIAAAATEYDGDCNDYHSVLLLDPDGTVRKRLLP